MPKASAGSSCASDPLRRVLAVNQRINSTLNLDELLGIVMSTAEGVVGAEAVSLMLMDGDTNELVFRVALGEKGGDLVEKFRVRMGEGIAGTVAQTGKPLIVDRPREDPRFAARFDQATSFSSRAILCVPLRSKGKVVGVLEALNPLGRERFSGDDLELFECFADQAAIAIENARLHSEILRQEKTRVELAIAREIQQGLLPDLSRATIGMDIAAVTIPAREVGGDFYDAIQLGESRISVILGDVSGKGVPAALYMVRTLSDYRLLAPRSPGPAPLLEALNEGLSKDARLGMFVTLLSADVDLRTGTVRYASAGHLPFLGRRSRSGQVELFDGAKGIPLGVVPGTQYSQAEATLEAGDLLLFFTDGILEARNRKGEEYSLGRLKRCLAEPVRDMPELVQRTLQDVRRFTEGADPHDDVTLLALAV